MSTSLRSHSPAPKKSAREYKINFQARVCVGNHYQSGMKRCTKFIGLLLLPSLGFVATINCVRDHVVIIIGRLLYPSHASNSFLLFRSGKGKKRKNFIFISRKKRHFERRPVMIKKKNFPSLHRAEKK